MVLCPDVLECINSISNNYHPMKRVKFLNTEVDNVTLEEALHEIEALVEKRTPSYVVTPNINHIVILDADEEFKEVYQNADLILTDGLPLIWLSKLKRNPIKEKVSGSDLFPKVCKLAAHKNFTMFFLGGLEGVAKMAAEKLKEKYPGLKVVGTCSPSFGFEKDSAEINRIIDMVQSASPDILAVGLGCPKQEKFIYRYKKELNVPVSLAIGASLDFEAGSVRRAPRWMQKAGLEWLCRICTEPKRLFKRYLTDGIKIIKIILKY